MPYITAERRRELTDEAHPTPKTVGELNYLVTMIADRYLAYAGANYEQINAVVGALECAKLEFYRRVAAPYEDVKLVRNGDVYHAGATR